MLYIFSLAEQRLPFTQFQPIQNPYQRAKPVEAFRSDNDDLLLQTEFRRYDNTVAGEHTVLERCNGVDYKLH